MWLNEERFIKDNMYFVEGIRIIKDRLDLVKLEVDEVNLFRGIDSGTNDAPVVIQENCEIWMTLIGSTLFNPTCKQISNCRRGS